MIHTLALAADGAWRVLLAGLLLGAGGPAVFALAVRNAAPAAHPASPARRLGQRAAAGACLGLVLVAVGTGLTYLVVSGFGHTLTFGAGFPRVVARH